MPHKLKIKKQVKECGFDSILNPQHIFFWISLLISSFAMSFCLIGKAIKMPHISYLIGQIIGVILLISTIISLIFVVFTN